MSTPIRESILSALSTRLGAARLPARSDMGTDITIEDTGEEARLLDYQTCEASMTLRIESLSAVQTGESIPTAENRLLAALIKATIGTDRTLSSLCDDIVYASGGPLLTEEPTVYAGVFATFLIRYRFDAGNPYTLTVY